MRELAPGLHVADQEVKFLGIEMGTRMTILNLDGQLLVHSPIDVDPSSVAHLGEPRWVIAPNKLHHLFVAPWVEAGLEGWAAPGLPEKRADVDFHGVFDADGKSPFGPDVDVLPMRCMPAVNEVVLFHRPSRTLILSDLLFNFPPTAPWATRAFMRLFGAHPGCRASHLERLTMKRDIARAELGRILEWDFERVILAHGDILESGGPHALRAAYHWLDLS
ncbi:MAG: hypothetical protein AAGD10_08740 [Myxococcota bacterium]